MKNKNLEQQATLFIANMLQEFISGAQNPSFTAYLHPDLTYFGPGSADLKRGFDASLFNNLSDFAISLLADRTVISNNYDVRKISDTDYLVSGFVELSSENNATQKLRITAICRYENEQFSLYHFHTSAPNTAISDNKAKQFRLEERLAYFDKLFNLTVDIARANIIIFDPKTNEITLHGGLTRIYQIPDVLKMGPTSFIEKGLVHSTDEETFLNIFKRIQNGESSISQKITFILNGKQVLVNIYFANIFDDSGKSIYAVGTIIHENDDLWALLENEYARNLVIDREFICEANISKDTVVYAKDILNSTFDNGMSYKSYIKTLAKSSATDEQKKIITDNLDKKNIEKLYNDGLRRFTFKFKGCDDESCSAPVWIESIVKIFTNLENKDLIIRIYHRDVTELVAISEEARNMRELFTFYQSNPAVVVHEINFSKNKFFRINEDWFITNRLTPEVGYSDMLLEFAKKHILAEDIVSFLEIFGLKNVLFDFSKRKKEFVSHFRQYSPDGRYRWQKCKLYAYLDPQSFEVHGFISLEDCHRDMESEKIFKYGEERDLLTGFYKKEVFVREADKFLGEIKNNGKLHGVILLDLDNFQSVNNTFGREYGDKVLSTVSSIIKKTFRHSDLCGRVSGDTFCILIKDIVSRDRLLSKADEICKKLNLTFTEGMRTIGISASVGIAFSNDKLGCTELLQMAKDAMYTVKKAGKNSYSVYLS